jgi:nitrite reductase (NADH) small subunit
VTALTQDLLAGDALPGVSGWVDVCRHDDLSPERGVAVLVADEQVALFRLADGSLAAVSNYDPFSCAYVLARGIVGTRGGTPTLASPMYKQVFDLRTGRCLDHEDVGLRVYPARVQAGRVLLGMPPLGVP